ncbi:M16 family metallopeptidase [Actinoplanes utahensis]|uniref:Peptidase n=1 Tax=Actinoplanes utahensis TaxID=1869 RepID=A0A0A6UCD5_ACTUT|nr:insulinase family protein [Actinoplanes utahensis]KHD73710.1 peptidase [Actinoplanes utahensis]GIF27941.1 hypothetical protein Aut01nite_09270 [Actinoplanes utahensis]
MITELAVDGVPVLLAPTTGPMHAGLAFRVGLADEPLARRGITHLVEHLALHSIGVADYHYNGATTTEFTFFHMQGAEADIVAFLNGVCRALTDLPMDRLPVEKEILRTEENGRGGNPADMLALWRHGARDYGTVAYPEWGLTGITPDDLRAWVTRYFNRGNAVLWIAGPGLPDGLELGLPDGERQPAPAASSALPVRPAYFSGPPNVVAWNAIVPRGAAAGVFTAVLERVLFRSLRQESGLSYTVRSGYEGRADGTAEITALADALPEKQGAVLGGFVDVLAAMRLGLIDEADMTAVVNQRAEELTRADETGGLLPGRVFGLLTGRPVQTLEQDLADLRAVTGKDVAEIAAVACADGLLMTPGRTRADWAGYAEAPAESTSAVEGVAYPMINHPEVRLIAGDAGVSRTGDDEIVTVRYAECAAVLAWPDGARRLIGHDGIQVQVEPTLFAGAGTVVREIDARLPAELRIPMPARDPDTIPAPPPAAPKPTWRDRARVLGGYASRYAWLAGLTLMTLVCGLGALFALILLITGDEDAPGLGPLAVMIALAVVMGRAAVAQVREMRE